jgi:hypothetical protein
VPRSNPRIALADRLCNDTLDARARSRGKI